MRPTLCKSMLQSARSALLIHFSVIGKEKPWISLPKGKGVKLSIADERDRRRAYAVAGN